MIVLRGLEGCLDVIVVNVVTIIFAVTCAGAPDLGFERRSHRPWPSAATASSSQSPAQTRQTLVFIDAVTAHGQAQSPPVRQIIRCSHRLVIAVTGADAPDLGF